MIRVRYEMQTQTSVVKVFVENPEHFITREQARAFIEDNKRWLTNAEIVEVTIRVLEA